MQAYTREFARAEMARAMEDWKHVRTDCSIMSVEQCAFHLFEDAGLAFRLGEPIPKPLAQQLRTRTALDMAIQYLHPSPFVANVHQIVTGQVDKDELHHVVRVALIQRDRIQRAVTMIRRNLPVARKGDYKGYWLRARFRTLCRELARADETMRYGLKKFAPAKDLAVEMRRRSAPDRIDRRREWWLFELPKVKK